MTTAKSKDHMLFQTMSRTGNIKQHKLIADENWSIYGRPDCWSTDRGMTAYFVHRCPEFGLGLHHYWLNYEAEEPNGLYDVDCAMCQTSAPEGLQALWRFLCPESHTTLVFIEEGS